MVVVVKEVIVGSKWTCVRAWHSVGRIGDGCMGAKDSVEAATSEETVGGSMWIGLVIGNSVGSVLVNGCRETGDESLVWGLKDLGV